jgi:aspartate/glutamate racemase
LFINSIPAVELTGQEENEEDLKDYINGLQELDQHQPDFIVMICNTIHLYLDRLQTFVQAPILDIRKQIKKNLD